MNLKNVYLTTLIPEIPKIINWNNQEILRYLGLFYDPCTGILTAPLNTSGNVHGAGGQFVNLVVDNLTVKRQYTNLYENITTANYDYYITNIEPAALLRDACTTMWEDPINSYINVQKPYYKILPDIPVALNTELKSQIVTLILDPSDASTGVYNILLNPTPPLSGSSYLDIEIDPSLSADQQTKWVSLICMDWDASYGATWEVFQFGDSTPGGGSGGGGGGVSAIYVNNQITNALLNYAYDPSLSDSLSMPAAVGGIPAGTTVGDLRGKTYEEIISNLLFATAEAYVNPYNVVSISGITATTMEVGTSYAPLTTTNYNRGRIYNGDDTIGPYLTGDASLYTYRLPNTTIDVTINATGNTQLYTYTAYNITLGENIWSVTVNYRTSAGAYYDNKGNLGTNLDVLRVASSISDDSDVVLGRRYAWWGSGADASTSTNSTEVRALVNKVFLSATNLGTFDISIAIGETKAFFFIPSGYSNVTVQYIQSGADVTEDFIVTDINVNDAGGFTQNYKAWDSSIGGIGYPSIATYRVTIT